MTVRELILMLQALPQDAQVYGVNDDGRASPCGNPSVGFIRQESDFIQGTATEEDLEETGDALVEYVVGISAEW